MSTTAPSMSEARDTLWIRTWSRRAVVEAHLRHVRGAFRADGWRVVVGETLDSTLDLAGALAGGALAGGALAVLDDPWAEPLPGLARRLARARVDGVRWRLPRVHGADGPQGWTPKGGPYTLWDYERRLRRVSAAPHGTPLESPAWTGFAVAAAEDVAMLLDEGWPGTAWALVPDLTLFRYDDPAGHDRRELDPFIPDTVRTLVDVGCGHGRLGARYRRPGRRVVGIEPDWDLAREARHRLDAVVPALAAEGLRALRPGVDCVVFADVLEHTLDPAAALEATASVLAPEGRVVVSIPNNAWAPTVRALAAGRWDATLAGTQARDHFVPFTRESFRRLAAECGLEVVHSEPIVAPLDWQTRAWAWLGSRLAGGRVEDLLTMQWILVLHRRS